MLTVFPVHGYTNTLRLVATRPIPSFINKKGPSLMFAILYSIHYGLNVEEGF